ncbi:ABC transporter permease [Endozoicomonas numazuensis]|uniref:Transport permease protein n=1 Tax=Endozoicomonas numazuensis TaxID=1137799 RepID=A0A081NLH2_9GAMM|nr:ABC transporter permease [Endozoicomonas numazuensis]KEQ19295.1 hypothetical protein GZ78_04765 [Endozoicomonas numazuensis]
MNHNSLTGFLTIIAYEVKSCSRESYYAFFAPLITVILSLIVIGGILGQQIGKIHGVEYLRYFSTGLLLSCISGSCYNHIASTLFSMRYVAHFSELTASPMPNRVIVLAYATCGAITGFVVCLPVNIIILFLLHGKLYSWLLLLALMLFTGLMFSLLAYINAMLSKKFKDISIFENLTLKPLLFFSGIYYDVSSLPDSLQTLSYFNPLFYLANAYHVAVLGFDWSVKPVYSSAVFLFSALAFLVIAIKLTDRQELSFNP